MDFFKELLELRETQPMPAILTMNSENCAYSPYHANGKNCYRLIGHNFCEDCYYGYWVGVSKDCVDNSFLEKSELCYECVDCCDSYDCTFVQDCIGCASCDFCYDCKGCTDCFGCVNLRNRTYCIFNKQYSKEDYFEKVSELKTRSRQLDKPPQEFLELKRTLPRNAMQGTANENVVGNQIGNSRNVYYSFDVSYQEDTQYIFNGWKLKDCADICYSGQDSEMLYQVHSGVQLYNSNFCSVCWFSQNLEYCEYIFNSHDCFGCISRNHASYEILNKPYKKEDYFKEVARIKAQLKFDGTYGHWMWPTPYPELEPSPSYMGLRYCE
jgi:hypothetical protein